ncbi:hypothetical protein ACFXGT_09805 [Streptomyces sp. NPDC059352]
MDGELHFGVKKAPFHIDAERAALALAEAATRLKEPAGQTWG